MGRAIPMINDTSSNSNFLFILLVVVCMAAVITISATMCGTRFRKKHKKHESRESTDNEADNTPPAPPPPSPPQDQEETLGEKVLNDIVITKTISLVTTPIGEDEVLSKPLPPPPAATAVDSVPLDRKKKPNIDKSSSLHNYMSSKTTRRKLSTGSISMRMPSAVLSIKRKDHSVEEDHNEDNTTDSNNEESLWTKKILLGEKCRLHDEDEEGDVLDVVIENRKRVLSPGEKKNGRISELRSNPLAEEGRT